MRPVILLASGGLDSTTVAYQLIDKGLQIFPIFFDYGQHCAEKEWDLVNEVLPKEVEKPERNTLSDLFRGSTSRLIVEANLWQEDVNDDDLYVPYRTLIFYAAAAARAQTLRIQKVYTGFINSNHAKEIDCATAFMNNLEQLTEAIGPVRFEAPFRYASKSDVVREALRLNVPIGRTFSCQASSQLPCGACPNCVERLSALRGVGLLS
jgi:7-cyano-7-deazaguanine synthase